MCSRKFPHLFCWLYGTNYRLWIAFRDQFMGQSLVLPHLLQITLKTFNLLSHLNKSLLWHSQRQSFKFYKMMTAVYDELRNDHGFNPNAFNQQTPPVTHPILKEPAGRLHQAPGDVTRATSPIFFSHHYFKVLSVTLILNELVICRKSNCQKKSMVTRFAKVVSILPLKANQVLSAPHI